MCLDMILIARMGIGVRVLFFKPSFRKQTPPIFPLPSVTVAVESRHSLQPVLIFRRSPRCSMSLLIPEFKPRLACVSTHCSRLFFQIQELPRDTSEHSHTHKSSVCRISFAQQPPFTIYTFCVNLSKYFTSSLRVLVMGRYWLHVEVGDRQQCK